MEEVKSRDLQSFQCEMMKTSRGLCKYAQDRDWESKAIPPVYEFPHETTYFVIVKGSIQGRFFALKKAYSITLTNTVLNLQISWPADRLIDSQDVFCSMELVVWKASRLSRYESKNNSTLKVKEFRAKRCNIFFLNKLSCVIIHAQNILTCNRRHSVGKALRKTHGAKKSLYVVNTSRGDDYTICTNKRPKWWDRIS